MNMLNCDDNCNVDYQVDDKFLPQHFDVSKIYHPCPEDCRPDPCKDIREGIFPFTGPKTVRNLCSPSIRCGVLDDGMFEKHSYIKHSFPIYRESGVDGCDKIVGAVWRETQGNRSEFTVKCPGDYYIKYTWDACYEDEPQFEEIDVCCDPCN